MTKHHNEDAAFSIKDEQYFKGDPQGYLAYSYDQKVKQNRMRDITDEEFQAKIAESAAFRAACGFGEKNAEPF